MCLYPKLIRNKKYMPNKSNNFNPPPLLDERLKYVAVGCGQCIECRHQKARAWQVRLHEELKAASVPLFVTLSFSPESIKTLQDKYQLENVNALATIGTRLFLERWRKKYKKSLRHWFVTELGHTNTERIHLHGIVFCTNIEQAKDIEKIWNYGNIFIGDYCTAKSVNYIVKYMLKIDQDHKDYKSIVLASAGLGANFITQSVKNMHKYRPKQTREYYTLNNGARINLPIYYRNKLYNEEEREKLWIEKIEKNEIYVRGVCIREIDSAKGQARYLKYLKEQQKLNEEIGFGNDKWKMKDYAITLKMINKKI